MKRNIMRIFLIASTYMFGMTVLASNAYYEIAMEWGQKGTNAGEFVYGPRDIAVDASGMVYVVDRGGHRVQIFSSSGDFVSQWATETVIGGETNLFQPASIAVTASGDIIIAREGRESSSVMVFSSGGDYLSTIVEPGHLDGQVDSPGPMTVGSSGDLIMSDFGRNRIQVFDSQGNFLFAFGAYGEANDQFSGIAGVVSDSEGNIYVSDLMGNAVKKFSSNGVFLARFDGGLGGFQHPTGLVVDAAGRLLVCESFSHRIQMLDTSGQFIGALTHTPGSDGPFEPFRMALDDEGYLYVVDPKNARIVKFAPVEE